MKRHFLKIGLALLILLLPSSIFAVKIVSWNVLQFYGDLSSDRIEDFRMVLDELQPDILVIQDMGDAKGVDLFLNEVLNHKGKVYKKAKFKDQDETASILFYKKKTIKLKKPVIEIPTLNRSVWGFKLKIKKGDGKGKWIYVYSVHFPYGIKSPEKNARALDAEMLRTQLNNDHKDGDLFIVCGTFNLVTTKEKAFKTLTEDADMNGGRLYDPLEIMGKWHKKKKVADVHTESTRKMKVGEGASGGLDDRYDNFFISQGFMDSEKFTYVPGSYIAYGNDGKHFKKAITVPDNEAVEQDMAEALYRASDHLPIVMELGLPIGEVPMAPSHLVGEVLSASSVKLTWADNSDNEDGFNVVRARNCSVCHTATHCTNLCHQSGVPPIPSSPVHAFSGHYHSWRDITTTDANVQTYTDTGLASGATYSYRVNAKNAKGTSANSNEVTVTTNSSATSAKDKDK